MSAKERKRKSAEGRKRAHKAKNLQTTRFETARFGSSQEIRKKFLPTGQPAGLVKCFGYDASGLLGYGSSTTYRYLGDSLPFLDFGNGSNVKDLYVFCSCGFCTTRPTKHYLILNPKEALP